MEREWSDLDCTNRTREKLFSHEFIKTTLNLRLSVSANRSSYLSQDKGAHALSLSECKAKLELFGIIRSPQYIRQTGVREY
jgi:hypothetical protein